MQRLPARRLGRWGGSIAPDAEDACVRHSSHSCAGLLTPWSMRPSSFDRSGKPRRSPIVSAAPSHTAGCSSFDCASCDLKCTRSESQCRWRCCNERPPATWQRRHPLPSAPHSTDPTDAHANLRCATSQRDTCLHISCWSAPCYGRLCRRHTAARSQWLQDGCKFAHAKTAFEEYR